MVLKGSLFPRIASTCEVDEDDSKTPDIIGSTVIEWFPRGMIQTF